MSNDKHANCSVKVILTPELTHHSKLMCVDTKCEHKRKFVKWLSEDAYWHLYDSGLLW
jgi:hypothetical protein